MSLAVWKKDQARKIQLRRRILQHYEQVTRNVSKTCRFFGVSRSQFYIWLRRYRQLGDLGLRDRPPGPRVSPLRTPPHIEALVLQLRRERRYGAVRLSLYLQRYYQVYLSPPLSSAFSGSTTCRKCPGSAIDHARGTYRNSESPANLCRSM